MKMHPWDLLGRGGEEWRKLTVDISEAKLDINKFQGQTRAGDGVCVQHKNIPQPNAPIFQGLTFLFS